MTANFVKAIKKNREREKCEKLNEFFTKRDKKGDYLKFELKEMLLFLIFDKKLKPDIKKLAFEVLMLNFEAVNSLKSELSKVFFISED